MTWITLITLLVAIWLIWRYLSGKRGKKSRNERILELIDPTGRRLERGERVDIDEVEELAAIPQVRYLLFNALRSLDREALIPRHYDNLEDQAATALAYWIMHPNELQDAPQTMELIHKATIPGRDGQEGFYFIFKFQMPESHRAHRDGWKLGIAGPLFQDDPPYETMPNAFCRIDDRFGHTDPLELLNWYLGILNS